MSFGGNCFLIRLRKVLATFVWTFLLYGGGGGVNPDDVSFCITFRGCGYVFLAVVKAFVEST